MKSTIGIYASQKQNRISKHLVIVHSFASFVQHTCNIEQLKIMLLLVSEFIHRSILLIWVSNLRHISTDAIPTFYKTKRNRTLDLIPLSDSVGTYNLECRHLINRTENKTRLVGFDCSNLLVSINPNPERDRLRTIRSRENETDRDKNVEGVRNA